MILAALWPLLQLQTQAPEIAWEVEYDGTVAPGEASPRWGGRPGENASATVGDDGLLVRDDGTRQGNLAFFSRGWSAESDYGAHVEVIVKPSSCTSRAGVCLLVADGVHEDCLTFFPDRVSSHKSGLSVPMDTTDGFHTYHVAIAGEDLTLWVDGELGYDGTGEFVSPAHEGRNVVGFGSISSAAESKAVWRSVKYALVRPPTTPEIDAEHILIYRKPGVYACFPSLINYGEGRLATRFGTRVRRSHIDGTGGALGMVSEDAGRTWREGSFDRPNPQHVAEDGSLVRAYARGWREAPAEKRAELEARGLEVRDVRDGVVAYTEGAFAARSTDGGETWETTPIEVPKLALLMGFNTSSHLRTSRSVRLTAVYGKQKPDASRKAFVLRSADDGKSWECLNLAGPFEEYGFGETALGEAADGTIVVMMRTEPGENGYLHVGRSTDDGLTWSKPEDTGIWGHPANLVTLPDGRMLCTYGYRRGAMGIRACLSSDNGRTWDAGNTIILRSDGVGNGGDLGYPITTILPDGRLLTIYYITLADQVTSIACTRWSLPE